MRRKRREYLFLDGFPSAEEMEGIDGTYFSCQGERNRKREAGNCLGELEAMGWGERVGRSSALRERLRHPSLVWEGKTVRAGKSKRQRGRNVFPERSRLFI